MCLKVILALIVATHPNPHAKSIITIAKNICHYSDKRNLDPYLVLGLIFHESNFVTKCVSRTKDKGLMQVNKKFKRYKCNLFNIECNIREGTKIMAMWKRICTNTHRHRYTHWLRHYNWNSRKHHLRVLWVAEAYRRGTYRLLNMIKNRGYSSIKLNYRCIDYDLCGAEPGE